MISFLLNVFVDEVGGRSVALRPPTLSSWPGSAALGGAGLAT